MFIKLKNGNTYAAGPENGGELFIYTKHSEKAGAGFEKTMYGYRKKISVRDSDVESGIPEIICVLQQ